MSDREELVALAWIPPYDAPEAFLMKPARVAEHLLNYSSERYRAATEAEYAAFVVKIAQEKPVIRCHRGESNLDINGVTRWEKRGTATRHCSYCGSLHPDDLQRALQDGKARLGGSDWKYGWPHKFYVEQVDQSGIEGKWYNKHLHDLDAEQFAQLASLLQQYTGIGFVMKDEKLLYHAPYHGYQR